MYHCYVSLLEGRSLSGWKTASFNFGSFPASHIEGEQSVFFGAKMFRPRLSSGEFDFIVEYDIRDVTHHAHDFWPVVIS